MGNLKGARLFNCLLGIFLKLYFGIVTGWTPIPLHTLVKRLRTPKLNHFVFRRVDGVAAFFATALALRFRAGASDDGFWVAATAILTASVEAGAVNWE